MAFWKQVEKNIADGIFTKVISAQDSRSPLLSLKVYEQFMLTGVCTILPAAREGNVFRSVCHYVKKGARVGRPPSGQRTPGQRPPNRDPLDRDPPGNLVVATPAISNHPTEMYSC